MQIARGHDSDDVAPPEVSRERPGGPSDDVAARIEELEARLEELTTEAAIAEQRYRLAMAYAPGGMALIDPDARILEVNQALCTFLGRSEDELLGMTTFDVTHPDDVEIDAEYGRRAMEGDTAQPPLEKRYVLPDGSVVWGLLTVSVLRDADGGVHRVLGQVLDITERVERQLAQERVLAAEREAVERLRGLDRMKNAFLSAISHELRTPLAVVHGTAATLKRLRGVMDPQVRDRLEDALLDQANRLSRLLSDLLDVNRLTRSGVGMAKEPFDVVRLVRDVVASSGLEDRAQLDLPQKLRIVADRVQVERIVVNLVSNAAKYAPDGTVRLRLTPRTGDGMLLEVHDEGPGIPVDELTRVFEPFHRSAVDHPQPGTGIGLALVAEFARMHGGRAWAEHDPAGGAHLYVALPGSTHSTAP